MRTALTLLILSMITACVPIPNRHYFAPPFSGILLRNGIAVPNAQIRLSSEMTDKVSIANTNEFGRFKVQPLTEIRMTTLLLGDPSLSYSLHIRSEGRLQLGWSRGGIGISDGKNIELICDLSKPSKYRSLAPTEPVQYCSPTAH